MNILITGASSGIGEKLAEQYSALGNRVFITARREENLINICNRINKKTQNCFHYKCDVSDIYQVKDMVKNLISQFGTIDLAILNAGVGKSIKFSELDVNLYKKIYEVNLFGVLNVMQEILPSMLKEQKGKIAVVSSMADVRGIPYSSAYSSSKTALSKAMEAARIELKKNGIKVITVRPGFVETEMTEHQKGKMPLVINADKAAKIIIRGIYKNRSYINFPLGMSFFTSIMRRIPNSLYEFILGKARSDF